MKTSRMRATPPSVPSFYRPLAARSFVSAIYATVAFATATSSPTANAASTAEPRHTEPAASATLQRAQSPNKRTCGIEKLVDAAMKAQPLVAPALTGSTVQSSRCDLIAELLALLGSKKVIAGRQLQVSSGYSVPGAERELASARADREIGAIIAAELQGEANEARRLLLEAAVLNDQGQLLARDLLLDRLATGAWK